MSEPQSQSSLNLRGVRVCSGVQAEPGPGSNYFDVDEYCLWNTIIGHDNCNDRSISKCVSPFTRSRDLISSSAADASSDAYLLTPDAVCSSLRDHGFTYISSGQLHLGDYNKSHGLVSSYATNPSNSSAPAACSLHGFESPTCSVNGTR